MMRTRKRDDDSQYNNSITSDATSLAALDASSMSATGSRSSLTFSSSKKNGKQRQQRPRKRRRKSLTDALQSISLDRDRGVPQQIVKMGVFPFSKSVSFMVDTNTGNSETSFGSSGMHNDMNLRQQLHRQLDLEDGSERDGDIYYVDDDNSQLTSSSDENEVNEAEGMEDDFDDDEEDDDEDSVTKKLSHMTEMEKAQRKVMLELVFGKNHRESRKAKEIVASTTREVSSCARAPPTLIIPASMAPLPLSPIPTKSTSIEKPTSAKPTEEEDTEDYKDPADRKIEELLRRSLKNLKEGSHPLELPKLGTTENDDDEVFVSGPFKTQDDMAIDHQIYSRSASSPIFTQNEQAAASSNKSRNPNSMALDDMDSTKAPTGIGHVAGAPPMLAPAPASRSMLPRSNSLPSGLNTRDTNAMEMDG